MRHTAAALLGIVLATGTAHAQQSGSIGVRFDVASGNVSVGASFADYVTLSLEIGESLMLDLSRSAITLPPATASDYQNGFVESADTVFISHYANVPHVVSIAADEETMDGPIAKPASQIEWWSSADDGGGQWRPLSTTPQFLTGGGVIAPGSHETGIATRYRLLVAETDPDGEYTISWTISILPAN
jgi:hypothetical protein